MRWLNFLSRNDKSQLCCSETIKMISTIHLCSHAMQTHSKTSNTILLPILQFLQVGFDPSTPIQKQTSHQDVHLYHAMLCKNSLLYVNLYVSPSIHPIYASSTIINCVKYIKELIFSVVQ